MIQKTSQRQLNALMGSSSRLPEGRTISHNGCGPEEWGFWYRDRHYSLEAVQHPIRARMCGFGDKDRRPLAPAAVAKMIVRRRDNSLVDVDDIDYDFFVVTVDLWSTDGKEEMNLVLHPSASDRYLPSHLAKPRKRQASELAGVPGGPNNPLTLTARSSTRPSPYPATDRTRPFSNHPPTGHDGGGGDDPNSLLASPTVPSSTQPSSSPSSSSVSYHFASSSDPWSTSTDFAQTDNQWSYSPSQTNNQSLTLPSIHSLDSAAFETNNQGSTPSSSSPIPFHMSLSMMSSLADLQNQYDLSPLSGSSASVNIGHIADSNHTSGFRSWTDGLFGPVQGTQNGAMHDSFAQLPNSSQLSTMDSWSPTTTPASHTALSQVSSFHSYAQHNHNSLSLPSQMVPSSPIPPLLPRQEKEQKYRVPSNTRDLNDVIANAIPRHTYTRTLVGPLSANAQRLQDEHRKPGIFFLFQDLSVRTEGTFRLRMRLMNVGVPPAPNEFANAMHTGVSPVLAQVFTEPFTVYSAKRFPGVPDTTALSIAFGNQGQKLPLRNRHAKSKKPGRLGRPDCVSSDEESS